ncbi:MAG: STAS domain-containing protein [Vicinamibacterales bacterium]
MSVVLGPCSPTVCVVHLDGSLRMPVDGALRHRVRAVLGRGQRAIVVDLARVPSIDAAGIGELVRAYNMTIAAEGVLRIVHTSAWVRRLLESAGLFGLLCDRP